MQLTHCNSRVPATYTSIIPQNGLRDTEFKVVVRFLGRKSSVLFAALPEYHVSYKLTTCWLRGDKSVCGRCNRKNSEQMSKKNNVFLRREYGNWSSVLL
jgi:hypothetical protein